MKLVPETIESFLSTTTALVQRAFLKILADGSWLTIDYSNRVKVDLATLQGVYESVDMANVKAKLKDKLEERIADKIFNSLATEIATDIKLILANAPLREDLRSIIRQHIKEAAKGIQ